MKRGLYKARTVWRLTGFSPALIRAWETRHGFLAPRRSKSGYRLYSEEDLRVLLRVRDLIEEGRSIGEVALVGRKTLLADAPDAPDEPDSSPAAPSAGEMRGALEAMGKLVARLDRAQLLTMLVETLVEDFDSALARVWLYERATNTLVLRASAGLSTATTTSSRARIDVRTYPYMVGEVARSRRRFVHNGLLGNDKFEQDWVAREQLASVAIFPMLAQGDLVGVQASFFRCELTDPVVDVIDAFAALGAGSIHAGVPSQLSPV